MDYLKRYVQGEYREVWAELLAYGPEIRYEPLFSEASAVAQETMLSVKNNISILYERLNELNYRFVYPERAFLPPAQAVKNRIASLESEGLAFPLSLRYFYEIVGSVCFIGSHPKLSENLETDESPFEYQVYTDPLTIFIPEYDDKEKYLSYDVFDIDNINDEGQLILPYAIEISGDAVCKAGQSGGGSSDILLPNSSVDAPLRYWSKKVTFVEYLRSNIQWGGFPGFEQVYHSQERGDDLRKFFREWREKRPNSPFLAGFSVDDYIKEKLPENTKLPVEELTYLTNGLQEF